MSILEMITGARPAKKLAAVQADRRTYQAKRDSNTEAARRAVREAILKGQDAKDEEFRKFNDTLSNRLNESLAVEGELIDASLVQAVEAAPGIISKMNTEVEAASAEAETLRQRWQKEYQALSAKFDALITAADMRVRSLADERAALIDFPGLPFVRELTAAGAAFNEVELRARCRELQNAAARNEPAPPPPPPEEPGAVVSSPLPTMFPASHSGPLNLNFRPE